MYIKVFAITLSCLFASGGWTAEINVAPGTGTLSAAIIAAANGDTLILQDGGFYGAATINKSLTLRPVNRATNALVGDTLNIEGAGIIVTVQGLKFSADVRPRQAAALQLLENEFLSGNIDGVYYKSSVGDGSLVIVGNRLASGSIKDINSDGAYIAGNVLLNGQIETYAYVWIVGNQIIYTGNYQGLYAGGAGSVAYILANRVRCNYGSNFGSYGCIQSDAPSTFIAGNVAEVNDTGSNAIAQRGIYADGSGDATVINNVIRGIPADATRLGSAIEISKPSSRVAGNIIIDYVSDSNTPINVTSSSTEVTHNLCFNNSGSCPAGGSNLNIDPQLIDVVDYALAANSPAINAGPLDHGWSDLDRTRNDMGVHGGPWDISQYDAQRDPNNYAPYVYPLFKGDAAFAGGVLDIQALGVAKLR